MSENHRVLEALAVYLGRWGVKVSGYQEAERVVRATVALPSPLLAMQVVEEFRGVPGSVSVLAEVGANPSEAVFSWWTRRG